MTRKFRNAQSYLGNTKEARERQRLNLIPGNRWQKIRTKELRLNCWWEVIPLETKQEIFEGRENDRIISTYAKKEAGFPELLRLLKADNLEMVDVPKEELKDEKYLIDWWDRQSLKEKEFLYKNDIEALSEETISWLFKDMYKCLKKKLALLEKG